MGTANSPDKVKLVISLFSNRKEFFDKAITVLRKNLGEVDYESNFLPTNRTDYYTGEMGSDLIRKFYAFKRLIYRGKIADIKIYTNGLERKLAIDNKRRINIDPGYMSLGKFILATTKNQQQRIYLKKGIFAECALRYKEGGFVSWEWTYPDYAAKEYRETLNAIREVYRKQIR